MMAWMLSGAVTLSVLALAAYVITAEFARRWGQVKAALAFDPTALTPDLTPPAAPTARTRVAAAPSPARRQRLPLAA